MGFEQIMVEVLKTLSFEYIFLIAAGVFIGLIVGALPGLTTTMGIALLTGVEAGELNGSGNYPHTSVLGHAQDALMAFRRACQMQEHPKAPHRHFRGGDRSPRRPALARRKQAV